METGHLQGPGEVTIRADPPLPLRRVWKSLTARVSLTWERVSHIEMKSGETKLGSHHEDRSVNYSLRDGNGQGEGDSHLSWNVEIERPYIRGSGLFSATFAELFSASILHIACPLTLHGPGVVQRTCPWVCLQTSEFLVKSLCISFPP